MNLADEIAVYQFGQGLYSENELTARFCQLDKRNKMQHFFALFQLLQPVDPKPADLEQALAESSLPDTYTPCLALRPGRLTSADHQDDELKNDFIFLLYVFKAAYQRHVATRQSTSTDWQYQNLSDHGYVETLLNNHLTIREEIYNDSGYRSEFVSMAKLWHNLISFDAYPARTPSSTGGSAFLTYDELMTESLNSFDLKNRRSLALLQSSLVKALTIRFQLKSGQAKRLVVELTDRYLYELYNLSR